MAMTAVPSIQPHLSAADAAELRPCGHLDLRPRQHPLPARFAGLAADRRADHALHRRTSSDSTGFRPGRCRSTSITSYGTTLRALIDEYDIDPYDFLDFAHDIDHSDIELNAAARRAPSNGLPGRKLILTNGSRKHAENVARKIGILDHFEDVFDIAASDFVPKPERRAYERFLDKHGVEPSRSAMFEDIAKNLVVPHDLGMTTTLIIPKTRRPVPGGVRAGGGRGAPHRPHHRRPGGVSLYARAAAVARRWAPPAARGQPVFLPDDAVFVVQAHDAGERLS